jgi:rhamnosyltransferase
MTTGDILPIMIAAIVVSFNGSDTLQNTVSSIYPQVDRLILIDNGSDSLTLDLICKLECDFEISVIKLSGNYGIAYALNRGVELALSLGSEWIITFDQDSQPLPGMVSRMLEFINLREYGTKALILSPNISYAGSQLKIESAAVNCAKKPVELLFAITSGNMIHSNVYKSVGLYDEALFIDAVDFEFCFRARFAGFRIFRIPDAVLNHRLGHAKKINILGFSLQTYVHSPMRRYYMFRNHFYLQNQFFFRYPIFFLKKNLFMFLICLQILFFENMKLEQFYMILKGLMDFLKGVKGKLV